jgi:hypothetical protein
MNIIILEDKKHEQNKKKDSNKIITNQVKAHKRKHKYDGDNNTSKLEPSDNNQTQHGIKLFVSFDNFKDSSHLKVLYLD